MHISLTRDEVQELLQLVCIGSHIRNTVFESQGVYTPESDNQLARELCGVAVEDNFSEVEEDFDGGGRRL